MKLSDLAKKAAALPSIDFDWSGPEQWHDEVFSREVSDFKSAKEYIDALRKRMAKQAFAINELAVAYKKMRDLMLEAEVA